MPAPLTALLALVVLAATVAYAQGLGGFRSRSVVQHELPNTGFSAARWRFGTNGAIDHRGGTHGYSASDQNRNEFLARTTRLDVEIGSYRIVDFGTDGVFDYPFACVSGPGEMQLTAQVVANFREFLDRGGFVLVDDLDGPWQLEQFRSQLRRVFPDRTLETLAMDARLFHAHFT